ncbi:hypothetical protein [Lysinibacillus sp. JNUCC-52]|uniref:hypothetical protein n=1 Tax=Lysinibacillus sp. JNUCC-52 TaxID=2792480 RepID=UPI0030821BE4
MSGCFTRNNHHVKKSSFTKSLVSVSSYDGDRLSRNSTEEEKLIIQTKSMQLGYEKEALKAYQQWMNAVQGI